MKMKAKVIAIANQKGGVGKTTTAVNLGCSLAQSGKRVLLIDSDAQGSLSISLGVAAPKLTISDLMKAIIADELILSQEAIVVNGEGVDLIPADIELAAMEANLISAMSREYILRQVIDEFRDAYDYILIDCMPSLGMTTINALAAADSVLIPVQPEFLSAKGLEQLLATVSKVRKQINPTLQIEGILLTMVDRRTTFAKDVAQLVRDTYGNINVFGAEIPHSVRAKEQAAFGKSIFKHNPKSKIALAYAALAKEVLGA